MENAFLQRDEQCRSRCQNQFVYYNPFVSFVQLFVLFSFYLSSSGQSSIGLQETVRSFLDSVIGSDMVQLFEYSRKYASTVFVL